MHDDMVHLAHDLHELGYHIHATDGTHDLLKDKGVPATLLQFPGGQVQHCNCFCRLFGKFTCVVDCVDTCAVIVRLLGACDREDVRDTSETR